MISATVVNFLLSLDSLDKKNDARSIINRAIKEDPPKYINTKNALTTAWMSGQGIISGIDIPYEVIILISEQVDAVEVFELWYYFPLRYDENKKKLH